MRKLLAVFLFAPFFSFGQIPGDSLNLMIGQMIMIGVPDFYDSQQKQQLLEDLAAGKIGGVILFEKNILPVNPKGELAKMISEIQSSANLPVFVSIDEEGGRVNRLKPKYGFHKPPSAAKIGQWDNSDSTFLYASKTAKNLHSLGINVNYAPSVDVNINPRNPVIGKIDRSFSADYQKVTEHARTVIAAHDSNQIATVLKHFPGHGSSKNDTHLGIADVSDTWLIEELYPYKALIEEGAVKGIMTSHVVNRSLDSLKLPGTLSQKMVNGLLRNFLGYQGVVFSDDLQMGAITQHYGREKAILLAIKAGVDVLMFANNVNLSDIATSQEVIKTIRQLVESGEISPERIRLSYQRITKLKTELGLFSPNYIKSLEKRLKILY